MKGQAATSTTTWFGPCHEPDELRKRRDDGHVTGGFIEWDRALQTFFAQIFSWTEDGEEEPHVWVGTYPGELTTAAAAIKIIKDDCIVPRTLGATLELERLASLGDFDGRLQIGLKQQFLRPPPPADDE